MFERTWVDLLFDVVIVVAMCYTASSSLVDSLLDGCRKVTFSCKRVRFTCQKIRNTWKTSMQSLEEPVSTIDRGYMLCFAKHSADALVRTCAAAKSWASFDRGNKLRERQGRDDKLRAWCNLAQNQVEHFQDCTIQLHTRYVACARRLCTSIHLH